MPVVGDSAILAAMPGMFAKLLRLLRPKRRWAQFTLRTFFALVTMLCAVLGLWIVPAERQRRAVAVIRSFGGTYDVYQPDPLPWMLLHRWLPADYILDVQQVIFSELSPEAAEAVMPHLHALPRLEKLCFLDSRVTDTALQHLHGLKNLQELDFFGVTGLTDAGLLHLSELTRLKVLYLPDQTTDAGLAQLASTIINESRPVGAFRSSRLSTQGCAALHPGLSNTTPSGSGDYRGWWHHIPSPATIVAVSPRDSVAQCSRSLDYAVALRMKDKR